MLLSSYFLFIITILIAFLFSLNTGLEKMIKAAKGVPITRMVVRKEEDGLRISDKHMTWSLSRNGLYDRAIILVRGLRSSLQIIPWISSTQ